MKSLFRTWGLAGMCLLGFAALYGQAPPPKAAPALTAQDAEAWLDGMLAYGVPSADVASVVVTVVKDGRILVSKGYGSADLAAKKPVVAATTMYRPGSVSKLFTWTAVMQLVEQHKIDLDRDINDYLDFKIPPAFGRPITMRELMQHTGGFEDHAKFLIVDDPRYQMTIEQYLKQSVPTRIFPPGEVPAYSNYGATLAGYIVQRVSGEPYAEYVQRHIFGPLGMDHSTLQQPLPASLAPDMSKGYKLGSEPPKKFEILNALPAGGAANSGDDMGRFMLAHLNDGSLGSARLLQPATAELMHRQSFQATPPLPGYALGFYHEDRNGHDIIAHEGDTNLFHTNLELILDQHVGFFIAVNSLGKDGSGGVIRNLVFNDFANRYFPAPPLGPEPTAPTARRDAQFIAGDYQMSRRIQTKLLDFVYLTGQTKIVAAPDGTLTVPGIVTPGGAVKHWREIGPYLWRDMDGHDRMAAKVENGVVKAVWFDETVPAFVLQPVPLAHNKDWIVPLLAVSLGILAIAALSWPISAFVRWRYGHRFAHVGARAQAYRLVRVGAIVELVFFAGMLSTLVGMLGGTLSLDGSNDWVLRLFQLFGLLGLVAILVGAWNLAETWRDKAASWWAKASGAAILLALVSASALGFMLHLMTIKLDY